jgi:hypothetical protein
MKHKQGRSSEDTKERKADDGIAGRSKGRSTEDRPDWKGDELECRKAHDGIAGRSKGRSTEDRPDRNGDEHGKLREGRKADDGIAECSKGRGTEDPKEWTKADYKRAWFAFDVVRTGVRSEEHLNTRPRILERPAPQMNKGTDL